MTAKEYLQQAYILDRRINITLAKIEKMESALEYKSPSFDSIGGSGQGDNMADTIAKIVDYKTQAQKLISELVDKRLEIEYAVQSVPDSVQREILERRYLLYQAWESHLDKHTGEITKGIAESMGYSIQHIFRLHGLALKNIQIPKDESK